MILSGALRALCAASLDLFKGHEITKVPFDPGRGGTASYRFISR